LIDRSGLFVFNISRLIDSVDSNVSSPKVQTVGRAHRSALQVSTVRNGKVHRFWTPLVSPTFHSILSFEVSTVNLLNGSKVYCWLLAYYQSILSSLFLSFLFRYFETRKSSGRFN